MLVTSRTELFLRLVRGMAQLFPHWLSNSLSVLLARYIGYEREERKVVRRSMQHYLGVTDTELDAAWKSFMSHRAVGRSKALQLNKLDCDWLEKHVEVCGEEYLNVSHKRNSRTLVMTYHHHYNPLFCALFGLMGYRTSVIAKGPSAGPSSPAVIRIVETTIKELDQHLMGGKSIDVALEQASVRPIVRAMNRGDAVISANDFPGNTSQKRRGVYPFFSHAVACVTGSVELALKQRLHIVTAFVSLVGLDDFKLTIRPVNASSVDEVIREYLSNLESIIQEDPGLWEGWRFGCVSMK